MRCSASARSSRCCKRSADLRHPGQRQGPRLRRTGRPAAEDRHHASATTGICCRSSTASSPAWAAASMNPRPWWTRACPTARASMPSFRRWPSTARRCRSAASAPALWPPNQLVRVEEHFAGDDGDAGGGGPRAHQHPDLGRNRRRQDHLPEHPVAVHSAERAHRHHRRRRRTAAGAGEHRAPRDPAAQCGRPGRDSPAATADQQPAHAPRPHHHRRGARRRGLRHAAGHEHRPRRLDDHHPRQHHRAMRCPVWNPWSR